MTTIEQFVAQAANFELTTERLKLRRFKATDLADEMAQQQNLAVMRYIRTPLSDVEAIANFQDFLKTYQGQEGEWLAFCVNLNTQPGYIGAVSFRYESLDLAIVEIGYRFNPNYHGKGYAFEATRALFNFIFTQLNAHKIVAKCDPMNLPSFKVMEKLGMQREGLLRQHYKIGEDYCDELVYGLLADEWDQ